MDIGPVDVQLDRTKERVVRPLETDGPHIRTKVAEHRTDGIIVDQHASLSADIQILERIPAHLGHQVDEVVARGQQRVHAKERHLVLGKAARQHTAHEIGMEQAVHHFLAEVRDGAQMQVGQQLPFFAQRDSRSEVHSRSEDRREIARAQPHEIVVRPQSEGDAPGGEIVVVVGIVGTLQIGSQIVGIQRNTERLDGTCEGRVGREMVRLVGEARTDVHARPVQARDEEILAVRQVRNVIFDLVVKRPEVAAVAGQGGREIEGRQVVEIQRVVRGDLDCLPQPDAEVHLGAGQAVRIQPDAQQQRGALDAVRAQTHAEAMNRRRRAMENQAVGLLGTVQGISHRLKGAGGLQAAHRLVDRLLVDRLPDIQPRYARHALGIRIADAVVLDAPQVDGTPAEIDGPGVRAAVHLAGLLPDGQQPLALRHRGVIAAQQHGVNRCRVETQHVEFAEFRLDEDVGLADILVEGVRAEHRDELSEDVADAADVFGGFRSRVGELDADQVVHPDRPGDVRREVVPHAAVHQHHLAGAHRFEEARDGHGRAHGRGDGAAAPVLRLRTDHVARHADVRQRQLREGNAVLVAHGHAGQQVVDVEAVGVAGGQRTGKRGHAGASAVAARPLPDLIPHAVAQAVWNLVLPVLRVVEREANQVGGIVDLRRVGNEFRRHAVGQHDAPVLAAEEFLEVRGAVAQGVEAAHEAADARSADEVDGDAEFLDILQRTHLGGSLRAASGQHDTHCRALLRPAHLVEPLADLADHDRVGTRVHAVRGQAVGVGLRRQGSGQQQR